MIGVLASMKNRSCKLSNYDCIGHTIIVSTRNEVLILQPIFLFWLPLQIKIILKSNERNKGIKT